MRWRRLKMIESCDDLDGGEGGVQRHLSEVLVSDVSSLFSLFVDWQEVLGQNQRAF